MELLDNPVRTYAWGSRSVIAELLGKPVPSVHPEAELWLGAHPADPSYLVDADGSAVSLLAQLDSDPVRMLGPDRVRRWSGRLPFLLKVLAAEEPLSLQAHPSLTQAHAGFARENALGLDPDARDRNYRDANHKPELVCALTELHALCGFRAAEQTIELLRELAVPELAAHQELLVAQPGPAGLRALFTTWITLPQRVLDQLVPSVQDGCVKLLRRAGSRFDAEARTVLELSERYPGDAGVLAALLLNRVTLAPGEALYQGAGVLHAYLSGAAIELMANSDNVLRGGLTPKHVDVPELLRVLDFDCGPPPAVAARTEGIVTRFETPVEEFALLRLDWSQATHGEVLSLPECGPRILLCTAGAAKVSAGSGCSLTLDKGRSMWLSAADAGVKVTASTSPTQLFLATDGLVPEYR